MLARRIFVVCGSEDDQDAVLFGVEVARGLKVATVPFASGSWSAALPKSSEVRSNASYPLGSGVKAPSTGAAGIAKECEQSVQRTMRPANSSGAFRGRPHEGQLKTSDMMGMKNFLAEVE
jgi:hypothetical protein